MNKIRNFFRTRYDIEIGKIEGFGTFGYVPVYRKWWQSSWHRWIASRDIGLPVFFNTKEQAERWIINNSNSH